MSVMRASNNFFTERLEPPSPPMVYSATMSTAQTISIADIGTSLRGASQTLFCAVLAVFVLVTIKPLMTDMSNAAPRHAMMNMSQDACAEMPCASSAQGKAESGDCERDCSCCPGICSAYLPTVSLVTIFAPLRSGLLTTQSGRQTATTSSLFRPPNFCLHRIGAPEKTFQASEGVTHP